MKISVDSSAGIDYCGHMASFGTMNDSYYQPADDRAWDTFVDYCDENNLTVEDEDFDAWVEDQQDRADDEAAERQMEDARERDWDL